MTEQTKEMSTAQAVGVVILILVMAFGMFQAGYKIGQEQHECPCQKIKPMATHEGSVGNAQLKHVCE